MIENRPVLQIIELTDKFNCLFKTNISKQALASKCKKMGLKASSDGYFKTGNVPFNKGLKNVNGTSNTTFKKGNVPFNLKPEGHERTDSEGYIYIKTKKGFVFKHRHIWEQAHGTIKKGMVLVFIDNDKTNCDLSNLVLVSRGELAILNKWQRFGEVTGALKLAMIYNVRLEKRLKECQ